jgi:Helicase associated domain
MWIIIAFLSLFLPGCSHCCSAFVLIDGRFPINRSLVVVQRKRRLPIAWRHTASSSSSPSSAAALSQTREESGPMHERVPDTNVGVIVAAVDAAAVANANAKWYSMLERLQNYQRIVGHCLVPKDYPPDPALGTWVMNQRAHYQTTRLSTERRQHLEDLGFTVRLRTKCTARRKEPWDAMFQRLVQYQAKHGDCFISHFYKADPKLGSWVSNQRRNYSLPNFLSDEQRQQLHDIGFVGVGQVRQAKWHLMFERLENYQKINGDCLVPRKTDDTKLRNWVNSQRAKYNRLSLEQQELLQDIGFLLPRAPPERNSENTEYK